MLNRVWLSCSKAALDWGWKDVVLILSISGFFRRIPESKFRSWSVCILWGHPKRVEYKWLSKELATVPARRLGIGNIFIPLGEMITGNQYWLTNARYRKWPKKIWANTLGWINNLAVNEGMLMCLWGSSSLLTAITTTNMSLELLLENSSAKLLWCFLYGFMCIQMSSLSIFMLWFDSFWDQSAAYCLL